MLLATASNMICPQYSPDIPTQYLRQGNRYAGMEDYVIRVDTVHTL